MARVEDRLSESMEDYLEAILMLSVNGGEVRSVDIARSKGVSKASVSDVLSKLGNAGYVNYERYRPVSLTKKGKALAERTLSKHKILIEFLNKTLGITLEDAEDAACKIEHAIGRKIAAKIAELVRKSGAEREAREQSRSRGVEKGGRSG